MSFYLLSSLRTHQQHTHPLVKELILSSLEDVCFSGRSSRHVFILSCVSGLWFVIHTYYLLIAYSLIYYMWSISVVRDLSVLYYFMIGVFLLGETAAIRKIFYVWSISIAKFRGLRNVAWDLIELAWYSVNDTCPSASLSITVYHKIVLGYTLTVMITWTTLVTIFLHFSVLIPFFFFFVMHGVQTNWSTCDESIWIFGFYTPFLRQTNVSCFMLITRYGQLPIIWRKNHAVSVWS